MKKHIDYYKRITPENITNLPTNHIFTFGSNESGRHGKGAAKTALNWGAKWGQAEGIQGNTYAIPTKDASIRRTLYINEIKPYVERFISYARTHQDLTFLVTEVGCGLVGLTPKEIAPIFKESVDVENIHLPMRFWKELI